METKKLYWNDPYVREFKATLEEVNENALVLDGTYFYPQSGGQASDSGKIEEVKVELVKTDGDKIVHYLEARPYLKVGDRVSCKIDWDKRYRTMRLHSAAHLLYYAMQDVFGKGCKPASPGLTDELKSREDYIFQEKMDRSKLEEVECKVNSLIDAGFEIKTWSEEQRRSWKIEPYPIMMCGGTHPRNTREIGRVSIRRGKKPGAGKERVEIILL